MAHHPRSELSDAVRGRCAHRMPEATRARQVQKLFRFTNSEVAPDGQGQPAKVLRSLGLGPPASRPRDLIEEGLGGRALTTTRAALEPLRRLLVA